MSIEAARARGAFEPAWPPRVPAEPLALPGGAGRYRPPPLHALASDPPDAPPGPHRATPLPLAFDEEELARAFGAGVSAGLQAASASAAVLRDRAAARALRLLRFVRRQLAAAQAEELDRIADHVASILHAVIGDLALGTAPAHAVAALRRLLRDALMAGAGQGMLTVETSPEVVAALRPALADQSEGEGAAAVELRVDPDLPTDGLRVRWRSGWAEGRAGVLAELLRERLAASTTRPTEGAAA